MDNKRKNSLEIALLFLLALCVLVVTVEVITAHAADAARVAIPRPPTSG